MASVYQGLTATPQTYSGTLNGKIVFTSPGHGWKGSGTSYTTDRPEYWRHTVGGVIEDGELVEDFGTQDQFTLYVDYLLRAGATVVPMRPVGRQLNEVVLDNDSPGVTFSGTWQDSTGTTDHYDEDYGASVDSVKYRFASTVNAPETAVATYTPNIPQAGFYPVYTWVAQGSHTPADPLNRTTQLYRINHTGGATEIRVDHRIVGHGWVYLGTYHFGSGSSSTLGSVQISNNSSVGGVAIADAIRFGNGMGDWIEPGATVISGKPREDENSEHWINRMLGQGTSASEAGITDNVNAPSNMAQWMYDPAGLNPDLPFGGAVYIGIHSNGTTGDPATATGRGARGLIEIDDGTSGKTPHQAGTNGLAPIMGNQINQDMQALNGVFEVNWTTGTTATATNDFGEINLGTGAEMDATIVEVGFHDNVNDNLLLRDPKARDQIARSMYQGTLQYFNAWGGATNTSLPTPVTNVRVVSNASGAVTLNWNAGPSTPAGVYGAAATSYKVYSSIDGYGFDGGRTTVSTSLTITGLDANKAYYFRVAAVNAGGESKPSEVVTALPSGGAKQVLIVNGFDRHDRSQNFRYPYSGGAPDNRVDRVWARYNNSFDYVVQVHSAIAASKPGVHVASTSNEAVISGAVNLNDYQTVIWILGTESTVNRTFDATEQTKVSQFLAAGGNLFLSGSEIAWDLDQQNNGRTFFENTLKGNYISDSAATYTAVAEAGGIFAGMSSFVFSNGSAFSSLDGQMYNVSSPDIIAPQAGAVAALTYSGGTGVRTAAIQFGPGGIGSGSIVMFGFPFETMTNATRRMNAMDRILTFFGMAAPVPSFDLKTRISGQDADSPTGPIFAVDSTVTFTYVLTNTGSVPITSVVVKDDRGTPGDPSDDFTFGAPTGDTNGNGNLDAGEVWTYTRNRLVDPGQRFTTGSVTAVGDSQNLSDSDVAYYFGSAPGIGIETQVNDQNADVAPGPTLTVGSTATFKYILTNTGNIALLNIVVKDDNGTPGNTADDITLTSPTGDTSNPGQLDLGETWTFTIDRVVTEGQYTNVGSASAKDVINQIVSGSNAANHFGEAAAPAENADFTGDGTVDAADYVLWRHYEGTSTGATTSQGDANDDDSVDEADYDLWTGQFGSESGGGSAEGDGFLVQSAAVESLASSELRRSAIVLSNDSRASSRQNARLRERLLARADRGDWNLILATLAERSAGREKPAPADEPTSETGEALCGEGANTAQSLKLLQLKKQASLKLPK